MKQFVLRAALGKKEASRFVELAISSCQHGSVKRRLAVLRVSKGAIMSLSWSRDISQLKWHAILANDKIVLL